jgi:hypothetical protein
MQIRSTKSENKLRHISNVLTSEQNYVPSDKGLMGIELFLSDTHRKNCKPKIYWIDGPENKKFIVDGLKIDFLTTIMPFKLDKVEVKPSSIAGNGLFAKKKILKDELITFYPGDIIEYTPKADRNTDGHMGISFYSKRFKKKFADAVNDEKLRDNDYAYTVNKYYTIIGCQDFKDDANYLGHFINDSLRCESDTKSGIVDYVYASTLKSNCTFYRLKDLHVAIIATKDILIGEELLMTYGPGYWETHNTK